MFLGSGLGAYNGRVNAPIPRLLAQIPLFAELSEDELHGLAATLHRRRYAKGEVVFLQGEIGSDLFVVESGHVKIVLTSPEGREFIMALLGPGDFFGELALLDGEPRSADAIAQEDARLLRLRREDFTRFLEERPTIAIRLLAFLTRRLRQDTQALQNSAFLDVPGRIARALVRLAETRGTPTVDGILIASKLTQTELAGMVGATRESVNKWLGAYERQGLIARRAGRILVIRPDELRRGSGE